MKIRKTFSRTAISILLLMTLGLTFLLTSCTSIDRNIDNYGEWKYLAHPVPCLPDTIDESATVNDYYCQRDAGFGTPPVEIFLDLSYTPEGLEAEIARLENLEYMSRFHSTPRKLKYDEAVLFNYPTFVAVYNEGGDYEYASIDKENSHVIYVYIQRFKTTYEELLTDAYYLPKNIALNANEETEDGYYFAIDTHGGIENWPE